MGHPEPLFVTKVLQESGKWVSAPRARLYFLQMKAILCRCVYILQSLSHLNVLPVSSPRPPPPFPISISGTVTHLVTQAKKLQVISEFSSFPDAPHPTCPQVLSTLPSNGLSFYHPLWAHTTVPDQTPQPPACLIVSASHRFPSPPATLLSESKTVVSGDHVCFLL